MDVFKSTCCCCCGQVLAISCEDRAVYFRQGVTSSELSGKTWKAINVPRDGDRSHSSASANSLQRWRGLSGYTHTHTDMDIDRYFRQITFEEGGYSISRSIITGKHRKQ